MTTNKKLIVNNFLSKVIVLDTESTGLDPTVVEICEVGVTYKGSDRIISEDRLFGTKDPIPFAASAKNNINRKMLEGKSAFKEEANFVKDILHIDDPKIEYFVAHNYKYDKTIIEANVLDDNGYPMFDSKKTYENLLDKKWIC